MFPELFVVDGIEGHPVEPMRLFTASRHYSLCELAKRGPVLFRGYRGYLKGLRGLRMVWSEQNSLVGFESQHAIAGLQTQSICHVFR